MVTPQNACLGTSAVHKIVQKISESAQKPPADAVTIDVLKMMELHLQRRGLIPESVGSAFRYLWFVAETERNVFLWRNGLSISDAARFEFWIDVAQLIEKRIVQLERKQEDNPFINPLWGSAEPNPESSEKERHYLEIFLEIYNRSAKQAHALCAMSKIISQELDRHREELVPVLIPKRPVEPSANTEAS